MKACTSKILIIGYGNIGKILYETELSKLTDASIYVYDTKFLNKSAAKADFPKLTHIVKNMDDYYDFAFICVPTNKLPNGECDTTIVTSVLDSINADTIVIRSTVPPNYFTDIARGRILNDVVYCPEFTSTTQHKGTQNFLCLGYKNFDSNIDCRAIRYHAEKVADLYKYIYPADFEFIFTTYQSASMAKYMMNCFIAMKVTFCCEMAGVCNTVGADYETVRNIFIKDSRINPSHTFVYKGEEYYDSHCLNKDIPAYIHFSKQTTGIMRYVDDINRCTNLNHT